MSPFIIPRTYSGEPLVLFIGSLGNGDEATPMIFTFRLPRLSDRRNIPARHPLGLVPNLNVGGLNGSERFAEKVFYRWEVKVLRKDQNIFSALDGQLEVEKRHVLIQVSVIVHHRTRKKRRNGSARFPPPSKKPSS